jgi:hypothetical protein
VSDLLYGNIRERNQLRFGSIWIRPTEHPGVLSMAITGNEINLDAIMADRQALIDAIIDITKLDNLEFGEIIFQSDWRANVRMAEHFGKGRVFLIGGA